MTSDIESDPECTIFDVEPTPALTQLFHVANKISTLVEETKHSKAQLSVLANMIRDYCIALNVVDPKHDIDESIKRTHIILNSVRKLAQEHKLATLLNKLWKFEDSSKLLQFYATQMERACTDPNIVIKPADSYMNEMKAGKKHDSDSMDDILKALVADPSTKNIYRFLAENGTSELEALESLRVVLTRQETHTRQYIVQIMEIITRSQAHIEHLETWSISHADIAVGDIVGSSAASKVHVCEWKSLAVAVKFFSKTISKIAFRDAAHVWTNLHHRNLLELYGACYNESPCFALVPFCKEGDVMSFLEHHPGANRVKLAAEVTAAIQYLHSKNVRHCKLRGRNVLIDDHMQVKVADFGLSSVRVSPAGTTVENIVQPNLRWLSPERLLIGNAHKPSDIYSLAVTIWEIFTSRKPWADETDIDARNCILEGKKLKFPKLNFGSSEMRQMIRSCWEKDAADRPDADAVANFFQPFSNEDTLPNTPLLMTRPVPTSRSLISVPAPTITVSEQVVDLSESYKQILHFLEEAGELDVAATLTATFEAKAKAAVQGQAKM